MISLFRPRFLFTLSALLVCVALFDSCGLRYTPVETPRNLIEKRQQAIMDQLKNDFTSRNLKYAPLKFGQSITVKPASHYLLDSLYEVKYKLEQRQTVNKRLEEQIRLQRQVTLQDTTPSYYVEKHVFSVEDQGKFEVFVTDISVSQKNEIMTIDILQSDEIDKQLSAFYVAMVLKESFIYPDSYAEESELAFYDFYEEKLNQLSGNERTVFLNFTLRLMQTAKRGKNLDKSYLIREQVRSFVQGKARNYMDERFNNMEELYDDANNLSYYRIEYAYAIREDNNNYKPKFCVVLLDPYLQLVEIDSIK